MMKSILNNQCKLNSGTVIKGKWHHKQYVIVRHLGSGATGDVYLARYGQGYVALKMSGDGMAITSEVNVLKSLQKVQGSFLGPSLLDVDDWPNNRQAISFYAMEYINGPDLLSFIKGKEGDWLVVLVSQLLRDLQQLHDNGWVFGDLKPENLIVSGPPPRIRCIDVGGTTMQGRAIKEYTEFFDRGYWGLGSRKADPKYDLFAVAMIMINIAYPGRFSKKEGGLDRLKQALQRTDILSPYEVVIIKALQGRFNSANEMRQSLLKYSERLMKNEEVDNHQATVNSPRRSRRSSVRKQANKGSFFETAVILAVVTLIYIIYILSKVV